MNKYISQPRTRHIIRMHVATDGVRVDDLQKYNRYFMGKNQKYLNWNKSRKRWECYFDFGLSNNVQVYFDEKLDCWIDEVRKFVSGIDSVESYESDLIFSAEVDTLILEALEVLYE